jgi:SOS regulatory protein LexA
MQGLTKRQEQTLDFIRSSIESRGYPPTLREIGEHMGIRSTNGVNDHLRALERKGYLRREDMKSRALKLVEDATPTPIRSAGSDDDVIDIPVVGRVAAGLPLLAEENVVDTVRVDRMLVRGGREVFGLRVTGDSMIEAGIFAGDYIFVRKAVDGRSRRRGRGAHRRRGDREAFLSRARLRAVSAGKLEDGAHPRPRIGLQVHDAARQSGGRLPTPLAPPPGMGSYG